MTDPGINWSYKQKKYRVLTNLVIFKYKSNNLSKDRDRDDDQDAEGATKVCLSSDSHSRETVMLAVQGWKKSTRRG